MKQIGDHDRPTFSEAAGAGRPERFVAQSPIRARNLNIVKRSAPARRWLADLSGQFIC
ncbi:MULTISPECIES: hypothetical protein [unclassified Bradyrhizobium]|uniref:hypothetical protein n=1 Tax=unclassified Bradyrhizobium TaxID=2631580 RepID=UPI001FFC26E1|nr:MULTISPECIES: hypothetical protein [unclassified Bradyrhizobium]MCK1440561.1 hypothetical protein [Bradyrhizobium sp. 15]MCK1676775.1 hypothetical protein [Bradyrhizobium sp. 150]